MTDFGRLRVAAIRNEDAESKNTRKRPDRTRTPDRSSVANNSGPFSILLLQSPAALMLRYSPIRLRASRHCKHVDLECSAVLYRMYCTPLPLLCPPFGSNRFGRDASAAEATPPAPLMSSGCSLSLSLSLSAVLYTGLSSAASGGGGGSCGRREPLVRHSVARPIAV